MSDWPRPRRRYRILGDRDLWEWSRSDGPIPRFSRYFWKDRLAVLLAFTPALLALFVVFVPLWETRRWAGWYAIAIGGPVLLMGFFMTGLFVYLAVLARIPPDVRQQSQGSTRKPGV